MAIKLNTSLRPQARPESDAFGPRPTDSPSRSTAQTFGNIAKAASDVENIIDKADNTRQTLSGLRAWGNYQKNFDEAKNKVLFAHKQGDNLQSEAAEQAFIEEFENLDLNRYKDSGSSDITRESVLANYEAQHKIAYRNAIQKQSYSRSNLDSISAVSTELSEDENNFSRFIINNGAAGPVLLSAVDNYVDGLNLDNVVATYESLKGTSLDSNNPDKHATSYLNNKVTSINRVIKRSLDNVVTEDEYFALEQYFTDLLSNPVFDNVDAKAKFTEISASAFKRLEVDGQNRLKAHVTNLSEKLSTNLANLYNADGVTESRTAARNLLNSGETLRGFYSNNPGSFTNTQIRDYTDSIVLTSIIASDYYESVLQTLVTRATDSDLSDLIREETELDRDFVADFSKLSEQSQKSMISHFTGVTEKYNDLIKNRRYSDAYSLLDSQIGYATNSADKNAVYQQRQSDPDNITFPNGPTAIADISFSKGFNLEALQNSETLENAVLGIVINNQNNENALSSNLSEVLSDGDLSTEEQVVYTVTNLVSSAMQQNKNYDPKPLIKEITKNIVAYTNPEDARGIEVKKSTDLLYSNFYASGVDIESKDTLGGFFGEDFNIIIGEEKVKIGNIEMFDMDEALAGTNLAGANSSYGLIARAMLFQSMRAGSDAKGAFKDLENFNDDHIVPNIGSYEAVAFGGNQVFVHLPPSYNSLVRDMGEKQGMFLSNVKRSLTDSFNNFGVADQDKTFDQISTGTSEQVARLAILTNIAGRIVKGSFDPNNLVTISELTGQDLTNPAYYNKDLGKFTRLGARVIIDGVKNQDENGLPIYKSISVESRPDNNGTMQEYPTLSIRNRGSGYEKIAGETYSTAEAIPIIKAALRNRHGYLGGGVMPIRRTTFFGLESDRTFILDMLEEQGHFAPEGFEYTIGL